VGEDQQQMTNMINIFVSEIPIMLKSLNENAASRNYEELKFYAHKLKSSIDLFQINGLQDDIRTLEKLATELNDIPALEKYVNDITATLENVLLEIQKEA
jgi:HPt (histidine-containing phosphotransfer) domain-containing protein